MKSLWGVTVNLKSQTVSVYYFSRTNFKKKLLLVSNEAVIFFFILFNLFSVCQQGYLQVCNSNSAIFQEEGRLLKLMGQKKNLKLFQNCSFLFDTPRTFDAFLLQTINTWRHHTQWKATPGNVKAKRSRLMSTDKSLCTTMEMLAFVGIFLTLLGELTGKLFFMHFLSPILCSISINIVMLKNSEL